MRFLIVAILCCSSSLRADEKWVRHTIDDTSRGADGVRVADINRDGLPDFATGWEEGGKVRIYQHPGLEKVKEQWPRQTVGTVKSAEDAVFVDLDADGYLDVISSCEGKTKDVYVHWSPQDPLQLYWKTEAFPQLADEALWMFAAALQIDQQRGVDLILGAKGMHAQIGWLQAPEDSRELSAWKWHKLFDVGWVMSIITTDVDGDGDLDILYSDRKGPNRGVHWLEYDASRDQTQPWQRHTIGGADQEVLFLALGDVDQDGREDIVCAVKGSPIHWFRRMSSTGKNWETHSINMPPQTGNGKGVAVSDLDQNGVNDIVFTCEHADKKHGVGWLSHPGNPTDPDWTFHTISGSEPGAGIKFDLIQILDLDGDGDQDVVTCEERDQLGVIWYENQVKR